MSADVEKRLKGIERQLAGYPGLGAAGDIEWLIATVREQIARAERADALVLSENERAEQGRFILHSIREIVGAELGDGVSLLDHVASLVARVAAAEAELSRATAIVLDLRGAVERLSGGTPIGQFAEDAARALARAEAAEKACAAMRAALEWGLKVKTTLQAEDLLASDGEAGAEVEANFRPLADALATDAGKDWVPRAEFERATRAFARAVGERDAANDSLNEARDELEKLRTAQGHEAAERHRLRLELEAERANTKAERQRCAEIVHECISSVGAQEQVDEAVSRILEGK